MNGIGRRSVIVGVALAATMSAGVALAAETGFPHGILKTAMTTPAVSQASLANPALRAAFAGSTSNAGHYVLPAGVRFASADGAGALARFDLGARTSEDLGAGGYASSLREAGYLSDSRNLSAIRGMAQIDLSQLADDLTSGAAPGATSLSSAASESTKRYDLSPNVDREADIRLASRVEGGSVGLALLADALTAGSGAGQTAFSHPVDNDSLGPDLPRLGIILAGDTVAGQAAFSTSADTGETRRYQAPGRLEEASDTFAIPVSGADYTTSFSEAPRYKSVS